MITLLYQLFTNIAFAMNLQTEVIIPEQPFRINHSDKILLLGSCFAENIGKKLRESKFSVDLNPFGTLYNAHSIGSAVSILCGSKIYKENDLVERQGIYNSFDHHSRFSATTAIDTLNLINEQITVSRESLQSTQTVLITLGTRSIYKIKGEDRVVSNCHKFPEKSFDRYACSCAEITEQCEQMLQQLWSIQPTMRVIFTVSPIRHWKDGAHENQLSKATLLLAIEAIQKQYPQHITYFPAYEIVMDQLRDYRFYADDMIHPSTVAINYIWEQFKNSYFTKNTMEVIEQYTEIQKAINHKPFNPSSEQYHKFIMQTLLKVEQLKEKIPFFDLNNERMILTTKLH